MNSWLFPQRLGRLAWLGRIVLLFIPAIALVMLTRPRGALRPYLGDTISELIGWTIVACTLAYTLFFIHLPRCRSLGLPGAALIVLFFPPLSVLLSMMFLFGSEGCWLRMRQRQRAVTTSNSHEPRA